VPRTAAPSIHGLGAPISASAVRSSLFPGPGSAILDPAVEAADSARSLQVHLPTRDHTW